ncbi:Fanconi anemia group I protein homolog [Maniola jurtina]|uniref:Fanconi anemia group I protein homolog n=1 Tax=Maniola jurtina TaxID=191418 RepID=UPI001E687EEC|nr:Fanconi anemia group I protein homolog [Maniola jurtina]XP_045771844.1 Fanconi anemia group I protein homolog [Maniola jurtina]
MEKASEIFSNIKNLGSDKESREKLSEYCNINIAQILQHLPQRILKSDGGYLLEYIFYGLPDKTKSKIVDVVLGKIRSEPISIAHCGDVISRVCLELPRLPVADLVRWSSESVQTVIEDSDVNMIWKDILPECLYTISSHDNIKHCGTEMSGEEFKIQCVHTLCQCRWTERQLVQLATMFKDMQLSRAELKQVVNKLCSHIVDLPPDTLPPVIHQLLKLCKVDNLEIVLSHLSNYFNLKLYNTLEPPQQDSESTTIDVDDIVEHSTKELSQCLSTCLYHFTQGAADPEIIRKHIKKWPKIQLLRSPFLIDLALAVSDKGANFRTACLDAIKSAIEFHVLDGLRRKESAWVRCSEMPDVDVSKLLKILTNESTNHRQYTVLGLINLAFSLLSVSRIKPTAQTCWSYGKLILVRLSKAQPETAGHILTQLADRLLGVNQQQYTDCLHILCRLTPVSVERCPQLSAILESCQPVGDYTHAAQTYAAVRPLISFSTRVRDTLVMVCRKGLYSRESLYRCLALSGFLTVLKEMKLSKGPLSRSQNSDQYSANSYLTQLSVDIHATNQGTALTSRMRNETICLEVVSILRRCLVQDAAVKKVLYRGLYECTKDKVVLHEAILEILYEHLFKYLPEEDNEKPLLLDKCVQMTGSGAVLVEPIGHLLFAIAQFLQPIEEEDLEDVLQSPSDDGAVYLRKKLTDILEKLCGSDWLSLVDLEEHGLTDLTPESRAKSLKVQQVIQCLEALIAHRIMQWNAFSSYAGSVYSLFRAYNQLMDNTKGSPKVGRKNKSLNETGETSKTQKSQKSQKSQQDPKGKGKGKGKSTTTVANLVKDRAAPFKPLPCLWDLPFCLRILELLYSETILWSSISQRNEIRGKRDFHLFALRCVQSALPENTSKQTVSTHILYIATLMYDRCVSRFQDMRDFDEHTTHACLELFKVCLTLVLSTKYSLKTESVLKGITGTTEEPESKCLAEIIEKLYDSLQKLETEGAEEDLDLIGKKIFSMLVQITTVLLETPVLACDAFNRMIVNLEDYLRRSKQPEILPLLSPLLTAAQREQQEATLLVDVLTDLTAALGVIDEESSSADTQSYFPTINSNTGHTALGLVCAHLSSRFKCTEHSLNRARDLTEAISIAVQSHQQRLERERKELYKSIVLQLCQLTSWSCSAAKLRCSIGGDSDRVLSICVRMFSILASMIKTLDSDMAEFVRPELERLLKFTGKKLSPATDALITYVVEASEQEETASKVLRRTKLNPRLVLEREQFCKHVILFGNKVKINFQQYLPEGQARDFKIKVKNSPQLRAGIEVTAGDDDNADNDVSINDANTVVLSGASDDEGEVSDHSDAGPSTTKHRRLS